MYKLYHHKYIDINGDSEEEDNTHSHIDQPGEYVVPPLIAGVTENKDGGCRAVVIDNNDTYILSGQQHVYCKTVF